MGWIIFLPDDQGGDDIGVVGIILLVLLVIGGIGIWPAMIYGWSSGDGQDRTGMIVFIIVIIIIVSHLHHTSFIGFYLLYKI